jgi:hypothetical protein
MTNGYWQSIGKTKDMTNGHWQSIGKTKDMTNGHWQSIGKTKDMTNGQYNQMINKSLFLVFLVLLSELHIQFDVLWKESLKSNGQQFHQNQQN